MTPQTDPKTAAGRAHLMRDFAGHVEMGHAEWEAVARDILAIEAEVRADLIERVEGLRNPYDGKSQDFAGPAAVGFDAAVRAVLALLRDDKEAGG